jgi:predicted O-methyltransferase YrrM
MSNIKFEHLIREDFIRFFNHNENLFLNLDLIYKFSIENYQVIFKLNFYNKQMNIFNLASEASNILEIGVNGGHSLIVMLLANPTATIYAFDICFHPYTIPCIEYLNTHFNNRIKFFKGDSKETLPKFKQDYPELEIDLFHVDGMHEPDTDYDFRNCYKLAKEGSVMMWDDSDNFTLNALWYTYINEGKVRDITNQYLHTYIHQHTIGLIKK